MNRYRTLPGLGPQKASASTVCQKCLKKDMTPYPAHVMNYANLMHATIHMNARLPLKNDHTFLGLQELSSYSTQN